MVVEHGFIFDGAADPSAIWLLSPTDGFGIFPGGHNWCRHQFLGPRAGRNSYPGRSPALRHRPRRLRSAWLAQEAEGAGGRLNLFSRNEVWQSRDV
jgi:hypothetical protein